MRLYVDPPLLRTSVHHSSHLVFTYFYYRVGQKPVGLCCRFSHILTLNKSYLIRLRHQMSLGAARTRRADHVVNGVALIWNKLLWTNMQQAVDTMQMSERAGG